MKKFTINGWVTEIDEESTADWYACSDGWACDCGHCRNYVAAVEKHMPEDFAGLLPRCGVDITKPAYVTLLSEENGRYIYQAQYPVVGWVLNRGYNSENFRILEPEDRQEPDGAPDFPDDRFDWDIYVKLPWVLDEEPGSDGDEEYEYEEVEVSDGSHSILISSELEEDTSAEEELLQRVIPAALEIQGVGTACEVDVLLTNDEGIHRINQDMREVDRATDVLSFPMFEYTPGEPPVDDGDADPATGLTPLGDMVLSLERARRQAEEYGHSYERELAYLSVHSILHLLGYDHLDEGPMKAQMREREDVIMNELGIQR